MTGPKNAAAAEAIDGAAGVIATGPMIAIRGELNTGRPCVISLPADATDTEILSLIDGVLRIRDELRSRQPASRIVLPS